MPTELKQGLVILWKWSWLLVTATLLAGIAGYWTSLQAPRVYRATTTLSVGQYLKLADPSGGDFTISQQLAGSYAQMVPHQPVLQGAVDALGMKASWGALVGSVYAAAVPGTPLLQISAVDRNPVQAVRIANEVGRQLILQSPTPLEKDVEAQRQFADQQVADLKSKISGAQQEIGKLESQMAVETSALQVGDIQRQISVLEQRISTWQGLYAQLLAISRGSRTNYVSVLEPASAAYPVTSNKLLDILLAATAGFLLAAVAALLIEYLDDSLRTPEDVSRTLALQTIGSIGRVQKSRNSIDNVISLKGPFSSISDEYRLLRSNVQFACGDDGPLVLLITSPGAHEGKSVVAANLAVSFAQMGRRTVLVEADFRHPSVCAFFGVTNDNGLTSIFLNNVGGASEQDFDSTTSMVPLQKGRDAVASRLRIEPYLATTDVSNLQLLPGGPLLADPADLLASPKMERLLEVLQASAEVVILDSPPLLPVADAGILAARVTGVVLVLEAGKTRAPAAVLANETLHRAGARVLGAVLNKAPRRSAAYRYGADAERSRTIFPFRISRGKSNDPQPVTVWGIIKRGLK